MQQAVKSLSSALRLLGFFVSEKPEWGVTELAGRSGLHKSQVSRILRTFEAYPVSRFVDFSLLREVQKELKR